MSEDQLAINAKTQEQIGELKQHLEGIDLKFDLLCKNMERISQKLNLNPDQPSTSISDDVIDTRKSYIYKIPTSVRYRVIKGRKVPDIEPQGPIILIC